MIKGIDISKWNSDSAVRSAMQDPEVEFVIIKATEGVTYTDPKFMDWYIMAKEYSKQVGFYHYARPENNRPEQEVNNFLAAIRFFKEGCFLAVDWEGASLKYPRKWLEDFCKVCSDNSGAKPFVYMSSAPMSTFYRGAVTEYPLWVATRGKKPFSGFTTTPNIMHQYAIEGNIDRNAWSGEMVQLQAYCVPYNIYEKEPECDCVCHYAGHCEKCKANHES